MIAVAVDDQDGAAGLAKEFKVAFPVVPDPKRKIGGDYAVAQMFPYYVLVAQDGKVAKRWQGANAELLEIRVKEVAKKK